jgi:tetratricopeptide (TPR) repeat protein
VEINKKAVKMSPKDYVAWGSLASAYQWSEGGHEKALEAYAKAIDLAEAARAKNPDDPLLLAQLADFYASSGKKDPALQRVRRALALAPDDPTIQFFAGETYELLGQRDAAIPLIVRALTQGYHVTEFRRSPEMASLRSDPVFQTALTKAKLSSRRVPTQQPGVPTPPMAPNIVPPHIVPPNVPDVQKMIPKVPQPR